MTMTLIQPTSGATFSRQFDVSSQSYLGYDKLTVSYNASATAVVGTNLTVGALVSVDNMTGSELYVRDYVLLVTLFCDDHTVKSSVGSPTPTQRYLYPGARWGPLNVSVPLTEEDTGLSPGQTANASVTLSLITDISYSEPGYGVSGYTPVFGESSTFVLIHDPGSQQSATGGSAGLSLPLLPSLLFGGGVLLLVVRVTAFRTRRRHDGET
jgi:hypothetical protein